MQVKTKNLLVSALVVLLVGALWYKVVYSPMESKASKAKIAAHDADTSAAGLRQALGDTSAAKKANGHDVPLGVMLAAIPVDSAEASFLRGIDALRVVSGADWQSITPASPVSTGNLTTITVGISVQGTEDELNRYVSGLAELKRIFVTDNVTITASGKGQGNVFAAGLLQLQVSGRIFSQPAAISSATAGATGTAGSATTPTPSAAGATTPATAAVQNG
ncbi:MAG TPA: type 4a pilus biogenesis protein PilO [Acidimicrobiia bacterium]